MKKQISLLFSALLVLFLTIPAVQAQEAEAHAVIADGEYDITFEVLKDTSDEVSATSRYMDSEAKLIVENGKTYAVVTLTSSAWWESLQTQASQPGSFEDDNFIEAEVLSEDKEANTRVVKFEVPDVTKELNAKIHIIVTGVPGVGSYDNSYDIRLKFSQSDTPVHSEDKEQEEAPAASEQIADGDYTIAFNALHEEEDKPSSMARYMESPALLAVKDGKQLVTITLTNNEQITAFQVEQGDSYLDATVVEVDEAANTRTVAFEVADLSILLNAKVEVHVAAQNYTGNHVIRLSFDQDSLQAAAEADPVPSDITFEDIQASWAKDYIESLVAQNIIKGVSEDRFAPNNPISRAQFAVLLSRALELPLEAYEGTFSDVTEELDWAVYDVEAANRAAIVLGNGGKFNPSDLITREQMVTMIIRAIEYKDASVLEAVENVEAFADEDAIHPYAKEAVELAVGLGIIDGIEANGENVFAPANKATRAQAAKVIYQLLEVL